MSVSGDKSSGSGESRARSAAIQQTSWVKVKSLLIFMAPELIRQKGFAAFIASVHSFARKIKSNSGQRFDAVWVLSFSLRSW